MGGGEDPDQPRASDLEDRIRRAETSHEGLALQVDDLAARLHKLTMELKGEGCIMEAFTMEYGGIGWAVAHMRKGWHVRRKGWNSPKLWVAYVESVQAPGKLIEEVPGQALPILPTLFMRTAQGQLVAWLASQSDLLADDWELVDAPQPGTTHDLPKPA